MSDAASSDHGEHSDQGEQSDQGDPEERADEPADERADEPADERADERADEPADERADEPADERVDEPHGDPPGLVADGDTDRDGEMDGNDDRDGDGDAGEPGPGNTAADLTAQQLEFFEREADHFFRGELAHEQRASWLLALASGLLIALWRLLGSSYGENLDDLSFTLMIITLLSLIGSVALSLWALWPLGGGKRPGLLRPWRTRRSSLDRSDPGGVDAHGWPRLPARFRIPVGDIVWYHYVAHRRRAEVKGRRVVLVTVTLFFSLIVGAAGIISSLLEPAW